jgi:DNA-binding transcriptional ArsR family regulator
VVHALNIGKGVSHEDSERVAVRTGPLGRQARLEIDWLAAGLSVRPTALVKFLSTKTESKLIAQSSGDDSPVPIPPPTPRSVTAVAKKSRAVSPRQNSTTISRLGYAIAHPTRVEILNFMNREGTASASMISSALGVKLGNVSYHMKVLREDCDLLELVRRNPVRGALERVYRVRQEAVLEILDWPKIPPEIRQGLQGAGLANFTDTALDAIEGGSLNAHQDTIFSYWTVTLDGAGWDEVNGALTDASRRIETARQRSAERRGQSDSRDWIQTAVGAVQFEIPAPAPPEGPKAAQS